MANLLTDHDPAHFHACCGLVALVHWLYRFYLLVIDVPDAGFGNNLTNDIISMIVMILPNATSFVFAHVPVKKGTKDGFTIWKEYRWHAFIFTFKMWLLQAAILYAKYFVPEGIIPLEPYYRAFLEFGVMLAASYVTSLYPKQESTIRGMYKASWAVTMAGGIQFLGRGAVFYGAPEPQDDIAFCVIAMFFIQLNAFNMTLRKKRITGPRTSQALYSSMLITAFYMVAGRRFWAQPPTGFLDSRFKLFYLAGVAYYCRRNGFDRFSSWIVALTSIAFVDNQFNLFQSMPAALSA